MLLHLRRRRREPTNACCNSWRMLRMCSRRKSTWYISSFRSIPHRQCLKNSKWCRPMQFNHVSRHTHFVWYPLPRSQIQLPYGLFWYRLARESLVSCFCMHSQKGRDQLCSAVSSWQGYGEHENCIRMVESDASFQAETCFRAEFVLSDWQTHLIFPTQY